jgi:membrane protease YdiL (CAAX protease family)
VTLVDRAVRVLPRWLVEKVPRDHWESDAAFRHRRRVVIGTAVTGAGVLGASLSSRPDSPRFYGLTAATAATWVVGGLAAGPLHLGHIRGPGGTLRRPVVTPVALGVGAFGLFYGAALVARTIPLLDRAISSVLRYADQGNGRLVLLTTLANGAAEEVFFRGALYAALRERNSVAASTGVYMLATVATRNPALVLASGVMGVLFGLQRRASGGIQAPMLTHLTWSSLMLRYLPPLFRSDPDGPVAPQVRRGGGQQPTRRRGRTWWGRTWWGRPGACPAAGRAGRC